MSLTLKKILNLNKKAWDNIAEIYDDRQISPISNTFKEFLEYLPDGAEVLDLGCGSGIPYARYMADNRFKVTGIDLSEKMVKLASGNVPEAHFLQRSMTEIKFKDKFDGACSSFSMLLLAPEMFLEAARGIHKALVSGGFFYLSLNEPPNSVDDPDDDTYVNIMGQDMYSRAYTVGEITAIFTGLGFTQVSFHREIQHSKEFGEEHVIEFIYQK